MTLAPIRISTMNPDAELEIDRARWLPACNAAKVALDVSAKIDGSYFIHLDVHASRDRAAQALRAKGLPEKLITRLLSAAGPFPTKRVVV